MGNLVRIWKNFITGELASFRKNEEFEPTSLVFDPDTSIIYYKFSEVVPVYSKNFYSQKPMDTKVGYMSAYIGGNGKYCCFKNNKIVEVG